MPSKLPGFESSLWIDHTNDYLSGSALEPKESKLYGRQAEVPLLPVPELEHSLKLYLKSTIPLCSPQELVKTTKNVENFSNGIGKVLQKRLLEVKQQSDAKRTSWFQEYWNDVAYLGYRDTIVYNVTYYLQFKDEEAYAMFPTRRAARFVTHALDFKDDVLHGRLSPDMKGKTGVPNSNTQWKFVFNTCRIPDQPLDKSRIYAGDVFTHLVVCRKNRFFKVETRSANGYLTTDELETQFNRVIAQADSVGTDPFGIGILTSTNRDNWYEARERLIELNEEQLREIESSAFVICFDDKSPVTREEVGHALLHSDGKNRFFDKSFQVAFFENGRAGYIGEHSMTDGLTTTRFVNETLEKLLADPFDVKTPHNTPFTLNNAVPPKPIIFKLTNENKTDIKNAEVEFEELIADKELKVFMFQGFGKNRIKTFKCSPDAFAQILIQFAYFKTFGYPRATYESTQTRTYLHGRTEVTRSCSIDSLNFSRLMTMPQSEVEKLSAEGVNIPKKAHELLLKACASHSQYTSQASKAMGCDRHFAKLKTLLKPGEDSSFFDDPVYARTSHWALSTSGLVGELMDGWGFGEVVPDGIGVAYGVQNDRLRFTVTSRNTWADRICANLESCLLEMAELCTKFGQQQTSKL